MTDTLICMMLSLIKIAGTTSKLIEFTTDLTVRIIDPEESAFTDFWVNFTYLFLFSVAHKIC